MKSVLSVDVAKGKSMVSLISSCGEVLIEPYEVNHKLNDFIKAYFMIEPRYALYSNEAYFRIIDGYEDDPMDGSNDDIFLTTIIKYLC